MADRRKNRVALKKARQGPKAQKPPAGEGKAYVLRLYVAGQTPRSLAAITNIRRICNEHLHGLYDLEVIDIYQSPLAKGDQIVAVPTLIKRLPPPLRHLIGDMSDTERVLIGLDLRPRR